jgi:hypothetical protein
VENSDIKSLIRRINKVETKVGMRVRKNIKKVKSAYDEYREAQVEAMKEA